MTQDIHGEHFQTELPGEEVTDYSNTSVRVIQCSDGKPYQPSADNSACLDQAASAASRVLEFRNPGALVAVDVGLPQTPTRDLHGVASAALRSLLVQCGMTVTVDTAGCGCIVVKKS